MMTNLRILNRSPRFLSCAAVLCALALAAGCIENPNSVGTETNTTNGNHTQTTTAGTNESGLPATGGAAGTLTSGSPTSPTGGSTSTLDAPTTLGAGGSDYGTGGSGTGATVASNSTEVVVTSPLQQVVRSELSQDTAPAIDESQYRSFISGANNLGLELFRDRATSEQNLVYSPVSLHVALSMAYAGARNETAAQMKLVLGDPFGDETYHRAVNKLLLDLRSRNLSATSTERPQSVELSLVDTWFLQEQYPVKKSYLDLLATRYDAGVRIADFGSDVDGALSRINQFASDATKGKITELMRSGDITDLTRAVLVNALYLNATWLEPFAVDATSNADFTTASGETVSIPVMHSTRSAAYQAGSNYQALRLPYIGDALSMLLVLPAEGQFATVRAGFDAAWIGSVSAALTEKRVSISLPKFRILWGTEEFNGALQSLGMVDAFQSGTADFTGISDQANINGLYIFKVLQKAFVGVDEAGTEAAAVSAVVLNVRSLSDATMSLNRPFLFSIIDKSGTVLFVGQVMDPR